MEQRKAGLKVESPGSDLGQLSGQYHEDINHGFYFCYSDYFKKVLWNQR